MAITLFILALLAALLGFIGLIVLIYGFKSNTLGNIKKGTVIFCIAIILAMISFFIVGKKCVRHYKQKVHTIGVMMNDGCCGPQFFHKEMMKGCCPDKDMVITENSDTTICVKTIIEKIKE